jgi:hypothetical protein
MSIGWCVGSGVVYLRRTTHCFFCLCKMRTFSGSGSGLLLLLLSAILSPAHGITVKCPGTTNSSGCKCQTTENVYCPAGFYCPGYSAETISDLSSFITAANCTVRLSDGELQCPCTPGFYCPENTLSPSYCCSGVSHSFSSPPPSLDLSCPSSSVLPSLSLPPLPPPLSTIVPLLQVFINAKKDIFARQATWKASPVVARETALLAQSTAIALLP